MGLKIQGNDLSNAKIAISVVNAKGPCDPGFHVPSGTNRNSIITLLKNTRGLSISNITNYLLLPPAYYINRSTGNTINTSYGTHRLWCRSRFTQSSDSPACFKIDENNNISVDADKGANGFNVRAFKDTVVEPDISWTCIFGNLTNGIYWNQNLKLISIVSDGNTIYTLQDRNVGATVVWQYGDSVTDDNSGYYFQRGNNHGFPRSGATEFYSTQQNPSGYGPGNWYDDSHWVKTSSNHWWSTANSNLWGQNNAMDTFTETYDVKEIYVGSNKVYPDYTLVLAGTYGNVYQKGDNFYLGTSTSNIQMGICPIKNYCPSGFHIGYAEEYWHLQNRCNNSGVSWQSFLNLFPSIDWMNEPGLYTESFGVDYSTSARPSSQIGTHDGYSFWRWGSQTPWEYPSSSPDYFCFSDDNVQYYKDAIPLHVIHAASKFTKWYPICMIGRQIKITDLQSTQQWAGTFVMAASVANPNFLNGISPGSSANIGDGGIYFYGNLGSLELYPGNGLNSYYFVQAPVSGGIVTYPSVSMVIKRKPNGYNVNYVLSGQDLNTGNVIQVDSGDFNTGDNNYAPIFNTPFLRLPDGYSDTSNPYLSYTGTIKILDTN